MIGRVLANKVSAGFWLLLGIVSFPLGWYNSIVIVWIASVYANVKTDWGTAEAADDTKVIAEIQELRQYVEDMHLRIKSVTEELETLVKEMSKQSLTNRDSQ